MKRRPFAEPIGMMTMGAKVFVDTNILLRAFHKDYIEHSRARVLFDKMFDDGNELWISRQVICEYLVQVTNLKTFSNPLSINVILAQLHNIITLCKVADETPQTTAMLLNLLVSHPTHGKNIHDANIVATMLVHEIKILLTLNIDDMKRFSDRISLISIDPIE